MQKIPDKFTKKVDVHNCDRLPNSANKYLAIDRIPNILQNTQIYGNLNQIFVHPSCLINLVQLIPIPD